MCGNEGFLESKKKKKRIVHFSDSQSSGILCVCVCGRKLDFHHVPPPLPSPRKKNPDLFLKFFFKFISRLLNFT